MSSIISMNYWNQFHIQNLVGLEAFLYTNYFGLKQGCVKLLEKKYGDHLIVDNAQAFFAKPIKGIDTFYSARKFFGLWMEHIFTRI